MVWLKLGPAFQQSRKSCHLLRAPVLDNWLPYAPKGANTADVAEFFSAQVPPASQTWRELETYRKLWQGSLVVKGIMRSDDAERATEFGVDGIFVSNHGGRQLDRAPAPIDVFPAIDAAVGKGITLMLDSGIRRGSDIITALCVGAKFTFLGRAGLSAPGCLGLAAIEILRTEIDKWVALMWRRLGGTSCTINLT